MNRHEQDVILHARIFGPIRLEEAMRRGGIRRKAAVATISTLYESGYLKRISDTEGHLVYDCTKLGKQAFLRIAEDRKGNAASKPTRRRLCQQYKGHNPS